ncbi:MAG TPA: PAS domain-containing protein [Rhizomicrobium sp.]|nr:PAS domain-containing protein [Rhizomicrobium sp.]
MTVTRQALAVDALSKLPLSVANRRLAQYWLSLWRGDEMPLRADFSPSQAREHLPGIGLFEVRPNEGTRCRLAGTVFTHAVGRELTGCDWREYTHKDLWAERLKRNTEIAMGSVGVGIRHNPRVDGLRVTQELQLPFADRSEAGSRLLLFHLDWRPSPEDLKGEAKPIKVADEFYAISLHA